MANKIDQFFEVMVAEGGSDLHISEGQPPKFRKHGDMTPLREEILTRQEMDEILSEICRPEMWEKFKEIGDLDFAYEMNAASRFRCNYHKHVNGYGAIFRLIPTKIKTIAELGVPAKIESFGDLRSGLVLVTGPTGSGNTSLQLKSRSSLCTKTSRVSLLNEKCPRTVPTFPKH